MARYSAIMAHRTTIDRAGRVVIPKPVRDALRLAPGDAVDIDTSGDEVTLRAARDPVALVKEQGIWVYRAGLDGTSVCDLIQRAREERIEDLGG
jgi:AbrB family looped-hinge helix DNA binding protein